jgi:hypothetical protein
MILCFSWSFIPFLLLYLNGLWLVLGFPHFPFLKTSIVLNMILLDVNLVDLLFQVNLVLLAQICLHEVMVLGLALRKP